MPPPSSLWMSTMPTSSTQMITNTTNKIIPIIPIKNTPDTTITNAPRRVKQENRESSGKENNKVFNNSLDKATVS
jgi:hypothetical protein